jgi:signal transduction histidine kinase
MPETILIVEDEPDVAEMIRYNLEKESYRTIIAYSGAEALKAAQACTPDLILLDIMLPDVTGWEVCRTLRESEMARSIPILMLTAMSSEEARINGLTLGADDFITKPFSIKELLLRIRKTLDLQRALRRLQEKEQEKDLSLKYLVHELKNSVTVIGGFSSLALRRKDSENYLGKINDIAKHADSLLNDASLLSRLETGEQSLPVEPLSLTAFIDETLETFGGLAKERRMEIVREDKASATVLGNRSALRQVLANLLSNAIKFNREGGEIRMSTIEDAEWTQVAIHDEGCGIPSTEIPRIFDRFYRAAGSEHIKGTGLGLYIAKRLVEAMAGRVSVESTIGVGSTFCISLQKSPAIREAFPSLSQQEASRSDTSPVRILR